MARDGHVATRVLFVRVNPHYYYRGATLYDVPLEQTHQRLLDRLDSLRPSDLFDGVSLVYIHYDPLVKCWETNSALLVRYTTELLVH